MNFESEWDRRGYVKKAPIKPQTPEQGAPK
jgi:hypothetical protein